jgi:predicted GNAT family acetyltransferase
VTLKFAADIELFATATESFLLINEAANGLILGITSVLRDEPGRAETLAMLYSGDRIVSAALQAHGANLILTKFPEEGLLHLASALRARGADFPGVVGPGEEAERFARLWSEATGRRHVLGMNQMIYQLTRVIPPAHAEGCPRPARMEEIDAIAGWLEDFRAESLPFENSPPGRSRAMAEKRVAAGEIFVWEQGGKPVSMAGISGPTRNGIRVNAVFTPKIWRRRGLASALVAELSQLMLGRGRKFCCLYADLANPTSNQIYQRLGYKPVCDSRHYVFL